MTAARTLLWLAVCHRDVARMIGAMLDDAALASDDWRRLMRLAVTADGDDSVVIASLQTWGWGYCEFATAAAAGVQFELAHNQVARLIRRVNAGLPWVQQPHHRERPRRRVSSRVRYAAMVAGVDVEGRG